MVALTVHIDEEVLERARREASRRGTSVERVTEEKVMELAGLSSEQQSRTMGKLIDFSRQHPLSFSGNKIPNREELNER
jgi:hypothetical protein